MDSKSLIKDYIELISKEGFINEDEDFYFKNIGSTNQEIFYDAQTQSCLKYIKMDYIEGRNIDLIANVHYSTLGNYETAESLRIYIDNLLKIKKQELTKEIICVNTIIDIKYLIEQEDYQCDNIFYDYPYTKGFGFSYVEHPSNIEYRYKHIEQTNFITVYESNDKKIKSIVLTSEEILELDKENIIANIKERLKN
jgi:hypothetical protein